jgi:hypothetical protein
MLPNYFSSALGVIFTTSVTRKMRYGREIVETMSKVMSTVLVSKVLEKPLGLGVFVHVAQPKLYPF